MLCVKCKKLSVFSHENRKKIKKFQTYRKTKKIKDYYQNTFISGNNVSDK